MIWWLSGGVFRWVGCLGGWPGGVLRCGLVGCLGGWGVGVGGLEVCLGGCLGGPFG